LPILWTIITVYIALLISAYLVRQKQLQLEREEIKSPTKFSDVLFIQEKQDKLRTSYHEHRMAFILLEIAILLTSVTTVMVLLDMGDGNQNLVRVLAVFNLFFLTNAVTFMVGYVNKTMKNQLSTVFPETNILKELIMDDETSKEVLGIIKELSEAIKNPEQCDQVPNALTIQEDKANEDNND